MSLSVDDLVSSFSSSHIGQEAIDLAALQVSLVVACMSPCSLSTRPSLHRPSSLVQDKSQNAILTLVIPLSHEHHLPTFLSRSRQTRWPWKTTSAWSRNLSCLHLPSLRYSPLHPLTLRPIYRLSSRCRLSHRHPRHRCSHLPIPSISPSCSSSSNSQPRRHSMQRMGPWPKTRLSLPGRLQHSISIARITTTRSQGTHHILSSHPRHTRCLSVTFASYSIRFVVLSPFASCLVNSIAFSVIHPASTTMMCHLPYPLPRTPSFIPALLG